MGLEMRTGCERCESILDDGGAAFICSYECTFCARCATEIELCLPELRRGAGDPTHTPRRR